MYHYRLFSVLCFLLCLPIPLLAEATLLIQDGQPRAEIVISTSPSRTTSLAAQELQTYLEKISGAKLQVVDQPTSEYPVKIYVGGSAETQRLGISADGLKYGAYRIVSGKNWLTLIGDDTDFIPIEPWPRSNNDIASGKMQAAWDEITGEHWGYPHSQMRKHYMGPASLFGTPQEQKVDKNGNVNVWGFDERGSFNAVCGYLRSLGVRWYLPGESGEIVPELKTIPLPEIDQVVEPDFPLRTLNFRFGVYGRDAAMWGMRLGLRQPYGRQAAHGLDHMTHNDYTLKNHPEWFALYGDQRDTQSGKRLNQLCYSNEELFQETVRYVRAQFDHFKMDEVSVMPPDGYTAICQCELCKGKDTPERGYRGAFSDYVWEFVNRVAKEVRKTHPEKRISNCAYGTYTQPPLKIDKLEPNLQVIIVGGRRPTSESRDEITQLRRDWAKKTDRPVIIFENYPFTGRGFYLPAYIPQVLGESINATKGSSQGEDIWLTMDFGENAIGYNHFLIYFTARMYWGGKDQDAAELFNEYCQLFYGPAAPAMREFFSYCENHWREMEKDGGKAEQALALFDTAKAKVDESSVYGQRIRLIDLYLNGLRNKSRQLAQKRGPVPILRLVGDPRGEIRIDGKLDDNLWKKIPTASTGQLRELQTGRQPVYGTSIKSCWVGRDLYFAIRCEEASGEKPISTTAKNGDQAIWYGDAVEILLNTESHSYYQLAVNPAGALIDLDRGADRNNWFRWDSQAEVATQIGDGYWTAEIRIPVVQDENDPLHQVIGHRPTQSLPWYINVCRQRIRENGSEYSAFAPTGTASFHEPMKFAHFYRGLSHQFPADESVTDFLIAEKAANQLLRKRKYQAAEVAYIALSEDKNITQIQKSTALEKAAECARASKDYERASQLAELIPEKSIAKTVQMENLLSQRNYQAVIDQYGTEDLAQWPFWQTGAGAYARARAYYGLKNGMKAEADLNQALKLTADSRLKASILVMLGNNREMNLQNDKTALDAYQQNLLAAGRIGSADQFRSVQGAVRILIREQKYQEAFKVLELVKIDDLTGFWRHEMLLLQAQVFAASDQRDQAVRVYRGLLKDSSVSDGHRRAAESALTELTPK
ncbi:DUF4838 domain-containing protein [Gimesia sp.]|uniref:DUF4838 domain-containing protein n=1 Tax=Gimesia sp. TaxID=2024833 RepID=UPI000C696115|nr:DUF4838 domain-containing protein [Gimesia sp.]MAX36463.1 hypothetical protein [Gimesia sp.]HBL43444.1 hypothetical protein [Planctomycetaceae bacterium]|tara:strand:+ start:15711 stop:19016 length:3306 start_codon:yes stop_codon:yes gene_type:complete